MLLKLNKKAEEFSLFDKDNKTHSLKKSESNYIVLYFYPKDNTSGCTIEAKEFSDNLNEFKKLKTEIIGISGGDNNSKKEFCNKNNLKLILLSDADFEISKKYGVYGKKNFIGKIFFGIKRTTFILDRNKKIIKVYENVKPLGHAGEILKFLKSL